LLNASDERLLRLPKAELHVHLDGSLRATTLLELAGEHGVSLPARDSIRLAAHMVARSGAGLDEYLESFRVTIAVMQGADAIERIAFELAEDHARENVRWLEVRFCPGLCTTRGLAAEGALDAALAGLARARQTHGIDAAVIVTALRTLPPSESVAMSELAVAYRARGVCAFDLAGAEAGHPVRDHLEALRTAREGGLPITIHAGEAAGAASIREALELGGATRIGHGTRLVDDVELLARVRDEGITLEVCLTSNVQTGAARSYADHPLRRFHDEGVRASLCTDNRLISGVTLTHEYRRARDVLRFTWAELVHVARTGFEGAFAPEGTKRDLLERFDVEVGALGDT
jgi:adenosine deaminase